MQSIYNNIKAYWVSALAIIRRGREEHEEITLQSVFISNFNQLICSPCGPANCCTGTNERQCKGKRDSKGKGGGVSCLKQFCHEKKCKCRTITQWTKKKITDDGAEAFNAFLLYSSLERLTVIGWLIKLIPGSKEWETNSETKKVW